MITLKIEEVTVTGKVVRVIACHQVSMQTLEKYPDTKQIVCYTHLPVVSEDGTQIASAKTEIRLQRKSADQQTRITILDMSEEGAVIVETW